MEVEPAWVDREEHERRKKNPHSRNPKRVTFENEETPNEYFAEIDPNDINISLLLAKRTNKINAKERWLMMSLFLLIMKKSLI